MSKILLINGPNLNLLGTREPDKYGSTRLNDLEKKLQVDTKKHHHQLDCFQSNAEHELINRIHSAQSEGVEYIVINPGAFTHTSIALRDALLGVNIPFIEIHISNVHQREPFRHHSYFSDIAEGVIIGLGVKGYELALQAAIEKLA
ncbi:MAG: type II 3-dehydroquinate dehydratase [Thiotrichaceae bacterium]